MFCQGGKNLVNYFNPGNITSNIFNVGQAGKSWIMILSLLISSQMFHDFLVLDKLAKVGYKVLGTSSYMTAITFHSTTWDDCVHEGNDDEKIERRCLRSL